MSTDREAAIKAAQVVAELVRSANRISLLGAPVKQRLLVRAAEVVEDARRRIPFSGEPEEWTPERPNFRWRVMSVEIDKFSDAEMRKAFLEAAQMIRSLKIILDAKVEVLLGDGPTEGSA